MDKRLVEFSLVILANDHNPTILNPDFLLRNQIVKDEWGWMVVGQSITTPAISSVSYGSKVSITVEPLKLQVTDSSGSSVEENHICNIVSNYVNALPHVEYNALGINFTMITLVDDADSFLTNRFLKDGTWNEDSNQIKSVGFKFSYELEGGSLTFSIDKGIGGDVDKSFIVTRANFHRSLDTRSMPTSEQIANKLNSIMDDWGKFQQLHSKIIED